ncbi:MAG TPA: tRNA dihydrouridine synthase DusB, partial [Rhodospirillales bacterium]|nr:tRNA dihydrouridine synthase DusB [Rhodospirillales bacterium]
MTLRIGSVRLNNPVILAPMCGVSDLPFRRLVNGFGAGLAVSEMIASKAMIQAGKKT